MPIRTNSKHELSLEIRINVVTFKNRQFAHVSALLNGVKRYVKHRIQEKNKFIDNFYSLDRKFRVFFSENNTRFSRIESFIDFHTFDIT